MEGSNGPGRGDNDVPPSPGGSSVEGEEDVFFHDNALPSPTNHTEGKLIYKEKEVDRNNPFFISNSMIKNRLLPFYFGKGQRSLYAHAA